MEAENPQGFVVRTEGEKAAWDNGFRISKGERDGWAEFESTTAPGRIWIAAARAEGPWFLSFEHPKAATELEDGIHPGVGPGPFTLMLPSAAAIHVAVDRLYRLSRSLPPRPLTNFKIATAGLPRTTEIERLVVQRIGQDQFREALLDYWGAKCPITGITDERLLRASHIVPWAHCVDDAHRLDVHNGLLISALWDAAFDAGLVTFGDDGSLLISQCLSGAARDALQLERANAIVGLTPEHHSNLAWHRSHLFNKPSI